MKREPWPGFPVLVTRIPRKKRVISMRELETHSEPWAHGLEQDPDKSQELALRTQEAKSLGASGVNF